MRTVRTTAELRAALAPAHRDGRRIGLVPTMGALHEGHLSLIRAARAECELVVVSVFVNPTQFGPGDDLEAYPRDERADAARAAEEGAAILYVPDVDDVYPEGFATRVRVSGLTEVLCGSPASRGSDHFDAVTTVVAKLLNKVEPDVAYFGQKDAQQAVVVKRMVRDLDFPVEVAVMPTVRESDGLAMSSRNAYLDEGQRARAAALSRALAAARARAEAGGAGADDLLATARRVLDEAGIEPEYLEIRDAETLAPTPGMNGRPMLIAIAARVGDARLIDNVVIEPKE